MRWTRAYAESRLRGDTLHLETHWWKIEYKFQRLCSAGFGTPANQARCARLNCYKFGTDMLALPIVKPWILR